MRKKVLAITFFLASLVTSVQSEEQDGWYLGTKIGWSHFNLLKDNVKHPKSITEDHKTSVLNAPVLGVFLGYDFNPYFGLEVENTTNGFFPHLMFQTSKEHIQFNSIQVSTKLSYPINDDFHIYSRFGGKVFWDNLLSKKDLKNMFTKQSSFFPSFSLGAEYIFDQKFITRLDYTWKTNIENIINHSVKPSLGDAVFSFGWKLGKPDISDIFSLEDSDLLNNQYTALNENINFPFNSVELKPLAYDKLEKLDHNIKNMKLSNVSIILSGHSDKIGSNIYNKKLSEDRAYNIKNYFASKGFPRAKITVQAMGKLYPLTDQVCNNVQNKSLLVSCLSPDRRVEIKVLSNQ